jgi:hypothetical protein
MIKIKSFLVTYDRLYDKVLDNLSESELESIYCYEIQKNVKKQITKKIKNNIKEWELPWNNFEYQKKQYYEYGTFVHLLNNQYLIEDSTHIGIFHYDVVFNKNSINSTYNLLMENNKNIFYQKKRGLSDLYLSWYELQNICKFMEERLDCQFNPDLIWNNGWISEALSITPKEIFLNFANYLQDNKEDIENILIKNQWGIMNRINHRICGIVERMWGFYLVSLNYPLIELDVKHDWDSYVHKHSSEENWIKK